MELLEKYFAELIQCVDASYLVIGIILVFRECKLNCVKLQ